MIIVDSSVWIAHLRTTNGRLAGALENGLVSTHPFIIGELALIADAGASHHCGARAAAVRTHGETRGSDVVDHPERLAGSGIGRVDAHLLASARLGRLSIWTIDRSLEAVVSRLNLRPRVIEG